MAKRKVVTVVVFAVYIVLTVSALLQDPRRTGNWSVAGWGDFALNQEASRQVLQRGEYTSAFVYPLPYVVAVSSIEQLPQPLGVLLWLVLLETAAILCPLLVLSSLHKVRSTDLPLAMLLGYFAARYYVDWDLVAANCNLIYIALVCASMTCMNRNRPWWAGVLLAASIACKLYSVLLVPYLVWRGRWQAAAVTCLGCVVFFILLPTFVLGTASAWELTASWWAAVRSTGQPGTAETFDAYLVSLHKTLLELWGPAGIWPLFTSECVVLLARMLQIGWLVTLVGVFWRRHGANGVVQQWCDVAVLLAAVMPLSPLLQPHQGAVFFVGTLVLGWAACRSAISIHQRLGLLGLLFAFALWQEFGPGGDLRGVTLFVQWLILTVVMLFPRPVIGSDFVE